MNELYIPGQIIGPLNVTISCAFLIIFFQVKLDIISLLTTARNLKSTHLLTMDGTIIECAGMRVVGRIGIHILLSSTVRKNVELLQNV